MKKIIAKLMGWHEQRSNVAEMVHGSDQKDQAKIRREQDEYREHENGFAEGIAPADAEIVGPSDSEKA